MDMDMNGLKRKIPLNRGTFALPGGPSFSMEGFVEDDVLKSQFWRNGDGDGGEKWFVDKKGGKKMAIDNSLETFRLDPMGCLIYTYCLKTQNETLVATALTKKVYSEELTGWKLVQAWIVVIFSAFQ